MSFFRIRASGSTSEVTLLAALVLALLGCKPSGSQGPAAVVGAATGGQGASPTGQGTGAIGSAASGPGVSSGQGGAGFAQAGSSAPSLGGGTGGAPASGTGGTGSLVVTGPAGQSSWPMMGYSAASTYNNTAETVLTKANAASLAVAWQTDMGTNVYGAPLQIGDKIYASSGASIKAFDAATGKELWTGTASTTGSMAYDGGTLYLYTMAGSLVAVDATNGQQKWAKNPDAQPGDGSSSPLIAGNLVLIGGSSGAAELSGASSFRGFLAAFDKIAGNVAWVSYTVPMGATGATLWSSPAADVAAGIAFGTTGNNHTRPATDSSDAIIGFDLAKGDIKWKNQRTTGDTWNSTDFSSPDADFGANPVLYEAMVGGVMTPLVSSGQKSGDSHAVRRDTGAMVWTRKLCDGPGTRDGQMGIFVNGAWSGKYMLFACNGGGASVLYALDGATGDIGWMTTLPGLVYGRTSVANHVGFVGAGTNLVVFDADSGAILKMVPSKGGTVAGTITIANGRVAYGEGLAWATGLGGSTLTVLQVK
jgi:polyvinyl alcohol dehydrogenase (cytochrome)